MLTEEKLKRLCTHDWRTTIKAGTDAANDKRRKGTAHRWHPHRLGVAPRRCFGVTDGIRRTATVWLPTEVCTA